MAKPTDRRALTLLPHWAHAVAHLGKRIENRKRPIPPALIGQRVAIHAGAALPRNWPGIVRDWRPWLETRHVQAWGLTVRETFPITTRAIVATAVIRPHDPQPGGWRLSADAGDLHRQPQIPPWADVTASDWWALDEVIALPDPVLVPRGQLGLWRLDIATVEAIGAAGGWP